eukprot:TRINITY_DN2453_c0_g1_i2.p1 TRINITY_DN2453_c0_g1~~TRINITY_DN2453_c0_g1_i2.p1  ORF type:complete len:258 (+),score=70.78 TRINITY_DN2453_c0_g1_i2:342-1115(+)
MALRAEASVRRRSEMAVTIMSSESAWVQVLKILIEKFFDPIKNAVDTPYPILPQGDFAEIFMNADAIYKAHKEFLAKLSTRVNTWDANSTLGDLFLEMLVNCIKLYDFYIDRYPIALDKLDMCISSSVTFATFCLQREGEEKVTLSELLEHPLKRLSKYVLLLQELRQYTADTPDHDKVNVVLTRLNEHFERHQTEKIGSIVRRKKVEEERKMRGESVSSSPPGRMRGIPSSPGSSRQTFLMVPRTNSRDFPIMKKP